MNFLAEEALNRLTAVPLILDRGSRMSGHKLRIKASLDGNYRNIDFSIECLEPDGAQCRVECPAGCASYTYPNHPHGLVNRNVCNAVEWMEQGDIPELFNGSDDTPLYDGMPIEIEWIEWQGYLWRAKT